MNNKASIKKMAACGIAAATLIPAGVLTAQAAEGLSNDGVQTSVQIQARTTEVSGNLAANDVDATAYAANNLSAIDRMGGAGTLAGIVILGGIGAAGAISLTRSFMIGQLLLLPNKKNPGYPSTARGFSHPENPFRADV